VEVPSADRRHAVIAHAAAFLLPIWAPLWIYWRTESSFARAHALRALIVQIPAVVLISLVGGALVGKAVEPWMMVVIVPALVGLLELPAARAASRGDSPGYTGLEE
jgi:hypothetical protein